MVGELDGFELAIACPACGQETRAQVSWLKSHQLIECGQCSRPIDLDEEGLRQAIDDAEAAVAGNRRLPGER